MLARYVERILDALPPDGSSSPTHWAQPTLYVNRMYEQLTGQAFRLVHYRENHTKLCELFPGDDLRRSRPATLLARTRSWRSTRNG